VKRVRSKSSRVRSRDLFIPLVVKRNAFHCFKFKADRVLPPIAPLLLTVPSWSGLREFRVERKCKGRRAARE
jgi:hypothetical protein